MVGRRASRSSRVAAGLGLALLCGALTIATWQGIQAWTVGVIGVPGAWTLPLDIDVAQDVETDSADQTRPWAGGVTEVAKAPIQPERERRPDRDHSAAPTVVPTGPFSPVTRGADTPAFDAADGSPTARDGNAPDVTADANDDASETDPRADSGADARDAAAVTDDQADTDTADDADTDADVDADVPAPLANPARSGDAPRQRTLSETRSPSLPWRGAGPAASRQPEEGDGVSPGAGAPSGRDLRSWVKSRANEFVGGVDGEGMPLYRFEVWLEPPAGERQRIVLAAYDYDAPSASPRSQSSRDRNNGFLVRFGAASCARTVTVAVTLEDGSRHDTEVDGCTILN